MPFKRGAPKGNRNRFVHGLYGKELMARKAAIRKRMQVVRMLVRRVTILCRLREALARKGARLQALKIPSPRASASWRSRGEAAGEERKRGSASSPLFKTRMRWPNERG